MMVPELRIEKIQQFMKYLPPYSPCPVGFCLLHLRSSLVHRKAIQLTG
jgi:hypothetical protein